MRNHQQNRCFIQFLMVIMISFIITTGCSNDSNGLPVPGCNDSEPGTRFCVLDDRDYMLHIPDSYTGETPVPLVVDMHGHHDRMEDWHSFSPWTSLADTHNFIIVHPQGYNRAWNAQGFCCAFTQQPYVKDDITFIENLVAKIQEDFNIDPNRIIAAGISNGGSMTHTLACESAHIFTAAAPMDYPLSGPGGVDGIIASCSPERPLPIIHFHGMLDDDVVYEGNGDRLAAQDSNYAWSVIQNCSSEMVTTPVNENMFCETYENCDGGVSVSMCTVTNAGHVVTAWVKDPDIATMSWDFLEQFFPN